MRVVLILILMVSLSCCDSSHIPNPYQLGNTTLSRKELLANHVIKKASAQLKKEKELFLCGAGGAMMHQIKMLALSFDYYKPLDIEQARELLVYSTTLFLKMINDNERIRPYLANYPFKSENIEIRIFLQMPDGSKPEFGKLTVADMLRGNLEYVIRSPETERLTILYEEPFEEGRAKLSASVGI